MAKETKAANNTSKAENKALKLGGYSAAIIIIAVVVAVVINLLVGKIPADYTKIDLTTNQLYSISDQTREVVGQLEEDVYVYLIAQTGEEHGAITELLDHYENLSDRLHIDYIDPVLYPNFASQYTDETLTANSLIVTSEKRSKVVPYSSIVVSSYNPNTGSTSSSFDGENQITSAIDYVTSDNLPIMYQLTGHGEMTLDSDLQTAIAGQNISLESLNLTSVENVPEDADCILIAAPQSDLTDEDLQKLTEYMENGGDLLLVSQYVDTEMPNLTALMAEYGLSLVEGMVAEGDANNMAYMNGAGYVTFLLPNLSSHEITDPLIENNYAVLYPMAQGIDIATDIRSTLTITELLTTSDEAFSKVDITSTNPDKEAGDIDGPFALGVAVEDDRYNGKIVWYTTPYLLVTEYNTAVSGGNYDLFLNTLGWMCERESSISIHSKSLSVEYLNINAADGRSLNIFFIGILPLSAIVIGGVVWYRRKKR